MKGPSPVRRLPWSKIVLLLAGAALASWIAGFLIGTVARLFYGL